MAKPNPSSAVDEAVPSSLMSSDKNTASASASAIRNSTFREAANSSSNNNNNTGEDSPYGLAWISVCGYLFYRIIYSAYRIRMSAIDEYGPVIHEFDPYFNFRATEYLYEHGAYKFFRWFDYMVWYPLGRPVGSTIYPGMQFTAVYIKRFLLDGWSLNDVCCYIPAWFGAIATILVGLLTYECTIPQNSSSTIIRWVVELLRGERGANSNSSNNNNNNNNNNTESSAAANNRRSAPIAFGLFSPALECSCCAMYMMAIVPAHLMRSVGGGYDNESIANTAMILTFYFWVRSLRDPQSAWMGSIAGLAYFYMVASWGGYIFVLNLVGVHAALLVLMGRFSRKLYSSYSLFYAIGTTLAIQVPVVGWAPLKSLEQLGPCAVFFGFQVLWFCECVREKRNMTRLQFFVFKVKVAALAVAAVALLAVAVAPSGYFGPLSSRVRGLFVEHTKTGNPLVDSVAEHQPASSRSYFQYLHHVCSFAPIGFLLVLANLSDTSSFLLVYAAASYFFSHKMVRLILLTAPIGSALGGIAAGKMITWCLRQWAEGDERAVVPRKDVGGRTSKPFKKGPKSKKPKKPSYAANNNYDSKNDDADGFDSLKSAFDGALTTGEAILAKRALATILMLTGYILSVNFTHYCWRLAPDLSNPTIIVKARLRDGTVIKLDDYREAYWWLRDHTPEDSRIMAWWDYGYQITALANRTTIADGNTWNHEHIALLGKMLTTSEEEGYQIARHLADYVLVWGGGGGDDLAKSPHLARIANSVYRDHCPPGDPTCRAFGLLDRQGTPSPMMERSLLYCLHGHQVKSGVEADPNKWEEVFRSRYGRVRIYKILGVDEQSKAWVEDRANRVCDVPGSWFCPGQYPPGLSDVLSRKKDFAQLEDFNQDSSDEEYQKQYFENLNNPQKAAEKARELERKELERGKAKLKENRNNEVPEPPPRDASRPKKGVDEIYNTWEDTEDTTLMWTLISNNQVDDLRMWLEEDPTIAFIRSRDGRGPMWWAFEKRNEDITKILMKASVPHTDRDAKGLTPVDLLEGK